MRAEKLHNNNSSVPRRRQLRASLTPAEATLWRLLQRSKLDGRKFRRQHGVGRYIVDFYCAEERLVVELDGAAHDHDRSYRHDAVRDDFLAQSGLTVLRIENRRIFEDPEAVLQLLRLHFRRR